MKLYRYSPAGSYIGWVEAVEPQTYEGLAGYTDQVPPAFENNMAPAWRNGQWVLEPDYRGLVFSGPGGERMVILEVGQIPPAGWTSWGRAS